ncbi:MAG: N-acetylmuramoyl-L-alanine amidase [Thiolinea sp.]
MKIAIDPGHGMGNRKPGLFDPGATSTADGITYREADIVLNYGLKLRDRLEELGHEIFMTRTDNEQETSILTRTRRAEAAGCKAIIALHNNAHSDTSIHGLETYYKGDGGEAFARVLQAELVKSTGMRDRGIHEVTADVPQTRFDGIAILVELGFISNANDRKILLDTQREEEVCKAICQVVNDSARQQTVQSVQS